MFDLVVFIFVNAAADLVLTMVQVVLFSLG